MPGSPMAANLLATPANVSSASGLGVFGTPARALGGKEEKAARDFESVLLTSLFDELQKSFAFDPQDTTPGAGDYRLMGTQALAEAVAAGGGIGIARLVLSHLHAPNAPRG